MQKQSKGFINQLKKGVIKMTQPKQYQIKADKLGTFQWYVDSLDYLTYFGISIDDRYKLRKAQALLQEILDKFETTDGETN